MYIPLSIIKGLAMVTFVVNVHTSESTYPVQVATAETVVPEGTKIPKIERLPR